MNETRQPDQQPAAPSPDTLTLARQKSFQDRIFGYSTLASLGITFGLLLWIAHSDLFGSAANLADLKPQLIKIVKPPIPQKPKPKKKEPPPPPPKQKPPPKVKPLKPPPPQPRPRPQRPTPVHRVAVATTHNTHAVSTVTVPETAPNTDQKPTASGDSPLPTPPAPVSQPPAPTPQPPAPKPEPPAPKPEPPAPKPQPPAPKPEPPAPPRHPDNWVPIAVQEASAPDNVDVSIDGIDGASITNKEVVISFLIDGTGRVRNARVKTSCGNSELDNRVLEAIKRARCQPAIQDHIPREAPASFTFPINV